MREKNSLTETEKKNQTEPRLTGLARLDQIRNGKMETQTAVTPLRAGDRRQRQFQQHGTPKPIFFDKVSDYEKYLKFFNFIRDDFWT